MDYIQPIEEADRDLSTHVIVHPWPVPKQFSTIDTNVTRASVTWDRPTDIDLHVWDSDGNHAWFSNPNGIPAAQLLRDVVGYGSEDFVERSNAGRGYTIGICYASGQGTTNVDTELRDPDGTVQAIPTALTAAGQGVIVGSTGGDAAQPPDGWCKSGGSVPGSGKLGLPKATVAPHLVGNCSTSTASACRMDPGSWTGSPSITYFSGDCTIGDLCQYLATSDPTTNAANLFVDNSGSCFDYKRVGTVIATNAVGSVPVVMSQSYGLCQQ